MNAQQEKIEIEQKVVMTPSLARDFGISPIPEEWYAKKPGSKVNLSIRNTNDRSFNKWFIGVVPFERTHYVLFKGEEI